MADRAAGILLDTSVVVAHLPGRIDIRALTVPAEPLFLPLVALGELYKGAEKSARPADNRKLVDDFLQLAALLHPDTATAESYAKSAVALEAKSQVITENDLWIAAVALECDMPLADLGSVREILDDVQSGRCFYCDKPMRLHAGHIDHFIPWSKYPLDPGHNFVIAHQSCNAAKADHLAAADFLAAWADRNVRYRDQLAREFSQRGVLHDLPSSVRIANWAYQQTSLVGGLTWAKKAVMVPLPADWQRPLTQLLESSG